MSDHSIIKRIKIKRIIHETDDAKSYVLEPLDNWQPHYVSGQFITLVFYTKHGEKRRSYSISSSPFLKEELMITVKHVDNGEFSRWMLQHLKEGDILFSSGISGFFILPESQDYEANVCFLAAGSGITPCFSMIKTLLAERKNQVTLLYSNASEKKTIFYKDLLDLQKEYPRRFRIKFLFSNKNGVREKRLSSWLLEQLMEEYFGNETHSTLFYLCGPFEYMQMAEITLRLKTLKGNIKKENFTFLERKFLPRPDDTRPHLVTVKIAERTHTLYVQYPKSILVVAKENSIDLPYSCEAGRCGSCIASCTVGKVWMAYNEILTDKEVEQGRVLICQAFPVGGDAEISFKNY